MKILNRILSLATICLSVCICPSLARTDYRVIHVERADGIASYAVVIPKEEFRKEALLRLADQLLGRYGQAKLVDIGIYTEVASVQSFVGKRMFDFTYGVWLDQFKTISEGGLPCGVEILKIGSASALRIRHPDARIEEVAIRKANVFHPEINSIKLDLLHVEFVWQGLAPQKKLVPHLYFSVSREVNPQEASALAKAILRSSGVASMEIGLRPDKWFVFDAYYPWVNPYAPVESPPSEDSKRSWQFLCHPAIEQACYQVHTGAR